MARRCWRDYCSTRPYVERDDEGRDLLARSRETDGPCRGRRSAVAGGHDTVVRVDALPCPFRAALRRRGRSPGKVPGARGLCGHWAAVEVRLRAVRVHPRSPGTLRITHHRDQRARTRRGPRAGRRGGRERVSPEAVLAEATHAPRRVAARSRALDPVLEGRSRASLSMVHVQFGGVGPFPRKPEHKTL